MKTIIGPWRAVLSTGGYVIRDEAGNPIAHVEQNPTGQAFCQEMDNVRMIVNAPEMLLMLQAIKYRDPDGWVLLKDDVKKDIEFIIAYVTGDK